APATRAAPSPAIRAAAAAAAFASRRLRSAVLSPAGGSSPLTEPPLLSVPRSFTYPPTLPFPAHPLLPRLPPPPPTPHPPPRPPPPRPPPRTSPAGPSLPLPCLARHPATSRPSVR